MSNSESIIINKVRVSFPHFFKRPVINGEEGKCGGVFMLDPEADKLTIKHIEKAIDDLVTTDLKGRKPPGDKLCLRDGNDKGRPEYEGYLVLSASNRDRPVVMRGDGKTKIEDEADSPIYAGCYVNAKVRFWTQNNKFGKRINAELIAVQFHSDGDPLDGAYISEDDAMSGFEAVDNGDDFLAA